MRSEVAFLNWHPLWGWISQRWKSFLDFMFYRKIPKSKPKFVEAKHQISLAAVSSFWLALTSSRPSFLASTFKMADELPWINRKNRCRIEESVYLDSCVKFYNVWWWPADMLRNVFLSVYLDSCVKFYNVWWWPADMLRNVFLPWWHFYVYHEPLDRWEIFKELSTDSVFMKRILLHRKVTYSSSSKCWKNWSPRNGVMDKTMTSSPWT